MTKPSLHQLCRVILAASVLALGSQQLLAATNYVTPGDSIQTAVNNASSGDTLIIFGGTYTESVTVDKYLNILRLAGQSVFITGSLTFSGINANPATPLVISNLKIGGDGSKRLYVNNCTNVTMNNLDLSLSGFSASSSSNIVVGNINCGPFDLGSCPYVLVNSSTLGYFSAYSCGNVIVANSTLQRALMGTSTANFSRVTVNEQIDMNNNGYPSGALNLLQCTVTNSYVTLVGGFGRMLYSTLQSANMVNADSVILGNVFRFPQAWLNPGAIRLENGKAAVRNNEIGPIGNPGEGFYSFRVASGNNGVWIANCEAKVVNNYMHDFAGTSYEGDDDRNGIYIPSATKKVEIVGNIFWGARRAVYGPFDNVVCRYNNHIAVAGDPAGGVITEGIISQDPLFIDRAAGNYQLATNSPCRNAGPSEAWYNDRDSTRNDMGIFGGAAYDPDGKTTDKPITFLLQASPLTVIKGIHTNLTFSGGGAVISK